MGKWCKGCWFKIFSLLFSVWAKTIFMVSPKQNHPTNERTVSEKHFFGSLDAAALRLAPERQTATFWHSGKLKTTKVYIIAFLRNTNINYKFYRFMVFFFFGAKKCLLFCLGPESRARSFYIFRRLNMFCSSGRKLNKANTHKLKNKNVNGNANGFMGSERFRSNFGYGELLLVFRKGIKIV